MTLHIELSPATEARLRAEAERRGQDAAEFLQEIVELRLSRDTLLALKNRKRPKSVDELKARNPAPSGSNGLAEIAGKWPGDESDDEIFRALEELS